MGRFLIQNRLLLLLLACIVGHAMSWSDTPSQYHIQTDEGEDRFFRYQTYNGQYRKERRLEDGTVVGSYGWVDPLGYLRLTDYIADNQGYRVLKNRLRYVGTDALRKATTTTTVTTTTPTTPRPTPAYRPNNNVIVQHQGYSSVRFPHGRPSTSNHLYYDHPNPTYDYYRLPGADKYANVDGLGSSKSGFLYRLGDQYHKEQTDYDGQRLGSFGYVDPFGIRRIVHYAAGQDGFVHRKENKYVGLNLPDALYKY